MTRVSHSGWAGFGFWINGTPTALSLVDAVKMKSLNGPESVDNDSHLRFDGLRVELGVSQVVWRRHEDLSFEWRLLAFLIAAAKIRMKIVPIKMPILSTDAKASFDLTWWTLSPPSRLPILVDYVEQHRIGL